VQQAAAFVEHRVVGESWVSACLEGVLEVADRGLLVDELGELEFRIASALTRFRLRGYFADEREFELSADDRERLKPPSDCCRFDGAALQCAARLPSRWLCAVGLGVMLYSFSDPVPVGSEFDLVSNRVCKLSLSSDFLTLLMLGCASLIFTAARRRLEARCVPNPRS